MKIDYNYWSETFKKISRKSLQATNKPGQLLSFYFETVLYKTALALTETSVSHLNVSILAMSAVWKHFGSNLKVKWIKVLFSSSCTSFSLKAL